MLQCTSQQTSLTKNARLQDSSSQELYSLVSWTQHGNELSYDLNATDFSGIGSWSVDDEAQFTIDSEGRVHSIVVLNPGVHGLTVSVTDIYGNKLEGNMVIAVKPSDGDTIPVGGLVDSAIAFVAGMGATLVVTTVVCAASRRSSSSKS
ncbi:hypothetical protein EU545_04550 [Candidatus Thorarchaeota archaeon]|nr:MAG: hypothetical protein EU545_04550 [Candidatus Thorarchaeota archaeon]